MKPCSKTRKEIAFLVMDGRDVLSDPMLLRHLEACAGCRGYLAEMSGVVKNLRALEPNSDNSDIRASNAFHRGTLAALKVSGNRSRGEVLRSQARSVLESLGYLLDWRIAAPTVSIAAVLIASVFIVARHPATVVAPSPLISRAQPARLPSPEIRDNSAPTVGNYEMAANQSLEKLDELITREGRRNPAPAPVYTAAAFARLTAAE